MKSLRVKNASRGRTLLEVCTTLALFALTGAISAPKLASLNHRLRVHHTSGAIEEIVTYLPAMARQHHETLSLRFAQNRMLLSTRTSPARRVRLLAIPPALEVRINTSDQKILAHPGGAISPARIMITGDSIRCSLTLSLWGRVRRACTEAA